MNRLISTTSSILKQTFQEWNRHGASRLGAALAYYAIFSVGPLLVIIVAFAGYLFGETAAQDELQKYLQVILGSEGAQAVKEVALDAHHEDAGGAAAVLAVLFLLFGAIKVVKELKEDFDFIWEVPPSRITGLWRFARSYVISLAAVLGLGFLLLISLVFTAILAALGNYAGAILPFSETVGQVLNMVVSFGGICFLFMLLFKYLPDVKLRWKDVVVGAVATTSFFALGKTLLGFYLGKQGLDSTFGASASLVLILLWVYYSAQILFFGAEFTRVYARTYGSLRHARNSSYRFATEVPLGYPARVKPQRPG